MRERPFTILMFIIIFTTAISILIYQFVHEFGYRIEAGGMICILFGLLVLAVTWWLNKKFRITK
ncbi:hypothetical protein PcaKH15_01850 [Parageobacillus caldoxylosilyticus]|nr:hypothetical protein PcaKH15_01850 [Parageobacillus caldoxylosilyticus]BDG38047.1 hypothetical protein PcaKH16_01860 [Parageobacillus caldoxylosilyticus]